MIFVPDSRKKGDNVGNVKEQLALPLFMLGGEKWLFIANGIGWNDMEQKGSIIKKSPDTYSDFFTFFSI